VPSEEDGLAAAWNAIEGLVRGRVDGEYHARLAVTTRRTRR
jgi:hypothetical protein